MKRPLSKYGIMTAAAAIAIAVPAYAWHRVSPPSKQVSNEQVRQGSRLMNRGHNGGAAQTDPRMNGAFDGVRKIANASVINHLPTRSPQAPRGDYYVVIPQHGLLMTADAAYLGKLNGATADITKLFSGAHYRAGDYEFQTAAVRGNYLYIPSSSNGIPEGYRVFWYVVDLTTGEVVDTKQFGSDSNALPYAMTYDETTDSFFGLSFNMTGDGANQLVKINAKDFSCELVRDNNAQYSFMNAIAYNPADKEIYIFDCDNHVFLLDRNRGTVDLAGDISTDGYTLFEEGVTLPFTYSPKDKAFVALPNDYEIQKQRFIYLDPESWDLYQGEGVTDPSKGVYIASMHCSDLYAEWDAPEIPAIVESTFTDSSLAGSFTIQASENQFSGLAYAQGTKLKTVFAVDGKPVFEGELTPGEKKTIAYTSTVGEHTATLYCQQGDLKSPVASKVFYTGHDNPFPVTNLKLDGTTLSWTASRPGGAHNGYVDNSALYYDVYFGETKQNTRPIQTTSYTITNPRDMALTTISVVAVANGMESERTSLNEIIGMAKTLPMHLEPTEADISIIKVIDANNDASTFTPIRFKDYDRLMMGYTIGYFNDADEWIFLPRTKFDSAEKLYNLTLGIGGVYTGTTREDVDIYIGKSATVQGMTTRIWNRNQLGCPHIPADQSINFTVPEAGEYYVGIHYHSKKDNKGRGLTLSNFNISDTGKSAHIPAPVTDCKITPAAYGALEANISVTLPTKDLTGADLDPAKDIKAYIECDRADDAFLELTGKPGATVSGDLKAYANGFNQYLIATGNDEGYSTAVNYTQYIGFDIPVAPRNLVLNTRGDNIHIGMTWDRPSEVGLNGAYVDNKDINYGIYMLSRLSAVDPKCVVKNIRTTSYEFTRPLSSFAQDYYNLAVAAENSMGYDTNLEFKSEILGAPYRIPMVEEYGTTAFDYMPVMRRTGAGYEEGEWKNEKDLSGMSSILGGNPILNKGGILYYNNSLLPKKGQIMLPKASTKGVPEVIFMTRLWDYFDTPNTFITGRTSSNPNEIVDLGPINLDKGTGGKWSEQNFILPDAFANQDWIQLFINFEFTGSDSQYVVIDSYSIKPNVDFDLMVYALGGPDIAAVGEDITASATIANSGLEPNAGTCDFFVYAPDGTRLAYQNQRVPRTLSGQAGNITKKFQVVPEWEKYEYVTVKCRVKANEDMVPTNDEEEFKVTLVNSTLPAVNDLTAAYNDDHTEVTLNWSEPDLKYGDYEQMETTRPFLITDQIGLFRNVDLDNRECFPIEGLIWPDYDQPQAWTVINAKELGVMNDARIHPHSGEQYLMARALTYEFGMEEAPRASDWLISPEVVGGTELSFWYNTIDPGYTEYVELWVSSTDDELGDVRVDGVGNNPDTCGSFRKVRSFSKSGSEGWEKCTVTLPEDAKYFALVYASFDETGAMLDDITFTPKELGEWTVDHYSVIRHLSDGTVEEINLNCKETTFKHATADVNAQYYVRTNVKTPMGVKSGALSNAAKVYALGVDDLTELQGVYGIKGGVLVQGHDGESFALYSSDGKFIRSTTLKTNNETITAEPGIYIVKAGNAMVKVLVK